MTSATERRATPWTMRSLREELARKRRDPQAFAVTIFLSDLESLLADADALAGALADAARYRAAIRAALDAGNDHVAGMLGAHEAVGAMRRILRAALASDDRTGGTG